MKTLGTGFTNGEVKFLWMQQEHQELTQGFGLKSMVTGLRNATISTDSLEN